MGLNLAVFPKTAVYPGHFRELKRGFCGVIQLRHYESFFWALDFSRDLFYAYTWFSTLVQMPIRLRVCLVSTQRGLAEHCQNFAISGVHLGLCNFYLVHLAIAQMLHKCEFIRIDDVKTYSIGIKLSVALLCFPNLFVLLVSLLSSWSMLMVVFLKPNTEYVV